MNVEKYIKTCQKEKIPDDRIKSHLMLHGYDGTFLDSEFRKIKRDRHFTFVYAFLVLSLLILWYYKPVITGLATENESNSPHDINNQSSLEITNNYKEPLKDITQDNFPQNITKKDKMP